MTGAGLTVDRCLVAGAVFLTCVLFLPAANDPVNVVKLTALLLVAIGLLVAAATRVLRDRVLRLPLHPAALAAAVLLVAFTLSALTAPTSTTAVLGAYGRNSGLLAYAAAVLLFLAGLRALAPPATAVLVGAVVASGLFTACYGLLQRAGVDPVGWANPFNPVIAALGNPNFASAYVGIAACAAVGGALWSGWPVAWRLLSAGTAVLCLTTAFLSASVQGPIAAAAGLSVVAAAWLLDQPRAQRAAGLGALGVAACSGLAVLLAGLVAGAGPAASVFADAGSRARGYYWEAAVGMFSERPLLGVGLDHYGSFWRSTRSEQSLEFLAGTDFADAAHSVPLQMLAQGGLVLGLAYAAFVLSTAVCLVRGLLRLRGADRMLLAAVGGAWSAYQVQSLVSIDQVPLLVLHFSLASGVVAASGAASFREVRLPGALAPAAAPAASPRRRAAVPVLERRRELQAADKAVLGVVGVAALYLAAQAVVPLRADVAARTGQTSLSEGRGDISLASYEQAVELLPGQAAYWLSQAALFEAVTPPATERALQAYEAAVEADPRSTEAVRGLARLLESTDLERSRQLHQRLLRLDPFNEATVLAVATFELRNDGASAARDVLTAATARSVGSAVVWGTLGEAEQALGDTEAARRAYERALALDPSAPGVAERLSQLPQ